MIVALYCCCRHTKESHHPNSMTMKVRGQKECRQILGIHEKANSRTNSNVSNTYRKLCKEIVIIAAQKIGVETAATRRTVVCFTSGVVIHVGKSC